MLRELKGKTVMLGVLDLGNLAVETAEVVAERIRRGLEYLAPDKLVPAPDCGMKYLPRDVAFGKLKAKRSITVLAARVKALADGAAIVRREIT